MDTPNLMVPGVLSLIEFGPRPNIESEIVFVATQRDHNYDYYGDVLYFIWEFIGKTKVEGVIVDKIILGEPDESGRKKPIIKKDSEYKIKSDLVIKALGFDPENLPKLFNCEKLELTKWGTIKIDFDSMQTSMPGVFAAGDIVRGASLVVWAIKDGRDVAQSIIKYLQSNEKKKVA